MFCLLYFTLSLLVLLNTAYIDGAASESWIKGSVPLSSRVW